MSSLNIHNTVPVIAWLHVRFFFGKNRVMAIALGLGAEDEYRPKMSELSKVCMHVLHYCNVS